MPKLRFIKPDDFAPPIGLEDGEIALAPIFFGADNFVLPVRDDEIVPTHPYEDYDLRQLSLLAEGNVLPPIQEGDTLPSHAFEEDFLLLFKQEVSNNIIAAIREEDTVPAHALDDYGLPPLAVEADRPPFFDLGRDRSEADKPSPVIEETYAFVNQVVEVWKSFWINPSTFDELWPLWIILEKITATLLLDATQARLLGEAVQGMEMADATQAEGLRERLTAILLQDRVEDI